MPDNHLSPLKQLTLLHAEDDGGTRLEMEAILGEELGSIRFFEDGLQAWEHFQTNPKYDVLLTDINMPHMDGVELVKNIKSLYPQQRIIVTSSTADASRIIDLINLGVDRFIPKPLDYGNLLNILTHTATHIQNEKQLIQYQEALESKNKELEKTLDDLHATQEKLIESKKIASLAELVSGIAHEINTPLGIAITAVSHLDSECNKMQEEFDSNTLKRKGMGSYLEKISESTNLTMRNLERASALVEVFKQISLDQYSTETKPVDLADLIQTIRQSFSNRFEQQRIDCLLSYEGDCTLNSHPDALIEVFTHILNNALEHAFLPDQVDKKIILSLIRDENHLTINYGDNGRGISEEDMASIFNPFYTTARSGGHVGLGLSIVYNLVTQKLQGDITCESDPPNGLRFTILLPLTPATHHKLESSKT